MNRGKFPILKVIRAKPFAAAVILVTVLPLLRTTGAYAHGIVGNRVFLSPIVGNDAFPDNALDLTMRRSDYQFSLQPSFEKQLGDNRVAYLGEYCELSVGAQVALNGAAPSGDQVAVIGLVEIFYDNILPALGWKPF